MAESKSRSDIATHLRYRYDNRELSIYEFAAQLEQALRDAVSELRTSEPVAWAVVTSDGDPREANSIHWPATCRHTQDGDAKAAAQAWADRFGYSIVPLYAPAERPDSTKERK